MGAHERRKGRAGEIEVLKRLNAIGGDGEILYGQAELGGKDGDVSTNYGLFEVKRRAAFPAWMNLTESVRGVYCRRDRGEWMVVVRAVDWETLIHHRRLATLEKWPHAKQAHWCNVLGPPGDENPSPCWLEVGHDGDHYNPKRGSWSVEAECKTG